MTTDTDLTWTGDTNNDWILVTDRDVMVARVKRVPDGWFYTCYTAGAAHCGGWAPTELGAKRLAKRAAGAR